MNTYILTYYKDEEPIVLQTELTTQQVCEIIDRRSELQNDEDYELCEECDSDIILYECQKLDKNARFIDREVLEY